MIEQHNKTEDAEVWKAVVGWEGLYEVSNLGHVRSLSRTYLNKAKRPQTVKGRERAIYKGKRGYCNVSLYEKGRKSERKSIHRLVATAFIPNPNNLPFINHKDENPSNNNVENLEWCTAKYNNNYGTAIQRRVEKNIKGVSVFDIKGNHIGDFRSIKDAAIYTKVDNSGIAKCCKKKISCAGGYLFRYLGDVPTEEDAINAIYINHPVNQYDFNGNKISSFNSCTEASNILGISSTGISACCRGIYKSSGGFVWRYIEETPTIEECQRAKRNKKVQKQTLSGGIISEYNSIREASRLTGIQRDTIKRWCKGNNKKNKYIWKLV